MTIMRLAEGEKEQGKKKKVKKRKRFCSELEVLDQETKKVGAVFDKQKQQQKNTKHKNTKTQMDDYESRMRGEWLVSLRVCKRGEKVKGKRPSRRRRGLVRRGRPHGGQRACTWKV